MTHPLLLLGALSAAIWAGFVDQRTGKIPNPLTCGAFLLGCVTHMALFGAGGIWSALVGALVTGSIPLIFFAATRGAALGGGDVKILGALGAWLGPGLGIEVELWAFSLLLLVTLVRKAASGNLAPFLRQSVGRGGSAATGRGEQSSSVDAPSSDLTHVRFGPYLAVATSFCVATTSVSALLSAGI